jgi:phytoene dehydrogenase-like protein
VLSTDLDQTAARLDEFAPGDGDAWRLLHEEWSRIAEPLIDSLLTPWPPVRAGARLLGRLGTPSAVLEFARLGIVSLRRLTDERFKGEGARLLLAGNLLHTDFSPESAGGVIPTLMLAMVGQDHGWPVPEGGAQVLTDTLVRRLEQRGGQVLCGQSVTEVVVAGGRAVAVRTAAGDEFDAGRAVLADTSAPNLYRRLLAPEHVPDKVRAAMERFHWDEPSFKVDWALLSPIPWKDAEVGRAGTVHIGLSLDELTRTSSELTRGLVPQDPFMLVGQMTVTDPSRSPAGTESAWAYCHVPRTTKGDAGSDGLAGRWDQREIDLFTARMEGRIEALAPGFRDTIIARHVYSPGSLEAVNPNLDGGAVGGGTAQLHQQLVFRPIPGTGRPETPIKGLYLASASAHPGGGVHGVCGNNAARAAIWHDRLNRVGAAARRALTSSPSSPELR